MEDDQFPEAVVEFGEPPVVTLRTSCGHPIFWIAFAERAACDPETLVLEFAVDIPTRRYDLQWQHLI